MRRSILLPSLLALAAVLVACGDDTDATSPTTDVRASAGATDEGSYPVSIDHAHGTTTIAERPERIVSLNVQWTDALLALDAPPVAYVLDAASLETAPYPWHAEAVADVERIDMKGALPYEALAALEPDLILATWLAADAAEYDRLSEIAPTIALLGDLDVDPWQDQVEVAGRVLGEEERAGDVIEEVEGEVAALAAELPELQGKTYVAANYVEGDSIWVVANPDDGASELFYDLGMVIAPSILAIDEEAVGRVQLSLEQVGLIDADFLGILTNGADPSELPGWDQLAAVRNGAVVDLAFEDIVGINTPTARSIPYVLELLRPALEKAAASPG